MVKRSVVVLLVSTWACTSSPNTSEANPEGSRAEVEAFLEALRAAEEVPDTALLRSMYVDDDRFRWIEDGQVRYDSPDAVLSALSGFSGGYQVQTLYEDTEIAAVGQGAAVVSMRFVTTVGAGDSRFSFDGMITLVLERGPAGWRILRGHTSTARPAGR